MTATARSVVVRKPGLGVDATLRRRLEDGARDLQVDLDAGQIEGLLAYLELLLRWNRVYNLTAVRDPNDMLTLHLLDSLSILPIVDAVAPHAVVDVGTGAGLPGVPIAIRRPASTVHLVDAVDKKIAFLRQAKGTLGLSNVVPHHGRIEALTLPEQPDLIISRAYADLVTMLASVDHLASSATTVVAMKGVVPTGEIERIPAAWRVDEIVALDVPGLGAQRCAVVLRRAGV